MSESKPHIWVRRQPGGQIQAHHKAPKMGLRNNIAAELTGKHSTSLSRSAREGKFSRLEDGSYHTVEFEAWFQKRNNPTFRVPAGKRGFHFESDESDIVEGAVVVHSGTNGQHETNGHVAEAEIFDLHQELIELKVQIERVKLQSLTLKLKADEGELISRAIVNRTLADIIVQFRESSRRLGSELAPSLVGLQDERDIKKRIDDAEKGLMQRIEDRIGELIE